MSNQNPTMTMRLTIGMVLGLLGILILINPHSRIEWVESKGMVMAATIRESNQVVNPTQPRARKTVVHYVPTVTYKYTNVTTMKVHLSKKVFTLADKSLEAAQAVIQKYPKGLELPVYYNKYKPRQSTLEINPISRMTIIGYASLLVGFGFMVWAVFTKPEKGQSNGN